MSIHTFYRLILWMPLLVPSLVALAVHAGLLSFFPGLLLYSLIFGGVVSSSSAPFPNDDEMEAGWFEREFTAR
jgi:hypothetical protein